MGRMKCRLRGFLQRRCERDIIGPCVFQSPIVSDSYCLFQKSVLFFGYFSRIFLFPGFKIDGECEANILKA